MKITEIPDAFNRFKVMSGLSVRTYNDQVSAYKRQNNILRMIDKKVIYLLANGFYELANDLYKLKEKVPFKINSTLADWEDALLKCQGFHDIAQVTNTILYRRKKYVDYYSERNRTIYNSKFEGTLRSKYLKLLIHYNFKP